MSKYRQILTVWLHAKENAKIDDDCAGHFDSSSAVYLCHASWLVNMAKSHIYFFLYFSL